MRMSAATPGLGTVVRVVECEKMGSPQQDRRTDGQQRKARFQNLSGLNKYNSIGYGMDAPESLVQLSLLRRREAQRNMRTNGQSPVSTHHSQVFF
jgi:hypothetical protein